MQGELGRRVEVKVNAPLLLLLELGRPVHVLARMSLFPSGGLAAEAGRVLEELRKTGRCRLLAG